MDKYLKSCLSQEQAKTRFEAFAQTKDNLSYNYFLKLHKGDSYEGSGTITFDLAKTIPNFVIDFAGATLLELVINDQKVESNDNYDSLRDKRSLSFPESHLKVGRNIVTFKFKNDYANDGCGLHSFVDTDHKQYIYSDCEPYHCNKIFPVFDQPDLKASLALTLAVPKDWIAIANQPACSETTTNSQSLLTQEELENYNLFSYIPTPRISSYLFALIAGPYCEVKCQNPYKGIEMSCFSRESLLPFLKEQAEQVFELTIEGVKLYEEFFGYPFPFKKYDSIFCPEYNQGAMENIGAVTFNDKYIFKEKTTIDRISARANTIAHELAHQWFGNLVTMKWWNDLWLNESFADYISHFCLANISPNLKTTKLSDSWLQFFRRKGWGYREDQQRTTHPIAGEVHNTDHAENIFDGITYSKGAATLKQLMHLIGRENFGKAMGSYFKKYEWSNTVLDDFIGSLEEYYKPSNPKYPSKLSEWQEEWLQKAGLNECLPVWDPQNNSSTAELTIIQSAARPDFPTLRHHKMKIAFFDENGKIYDAQDIVLENKERTTITYDGTKKPRAVFLNYQDETFIKTRLDEYSLAFLKDKIHTVPDELTRAMIWQSIYNMVKDGTFSPYQFAEIAREGIQKETSDSCLDSILTYTSASLTFAPRILRDNYMKPQLFDATLKSLLATEESNANKRILLRDNLIKFAAYGKDLDVDNIKRLVGWFEGSDPELSKIELSTSNRWTIVNKIHRYPKIEDVKKKQFFDKVAETDTSDEMKSAQSLCEALLASGEERQKLWNSFLDLENKTSVHAIAKSMRGYNDSLHNTSDHEKVFFDNIINIFRNRPNKFANAYYNNLFPSGENLQYYVERVKALVDEAQGLDILVRNLQETLDDLEIQRRGYLSSAPDLLRLQFNIHL